MNGNLKHSPSAKDIQTALFSWGNCFYITNKVLENPAMKSLRINKGKKLIYLFFKLRQEKYIREKFYLSIYSKSTWRKSKETFLPSQSLSTQGKIIEFENTYEQYLRLNNQQKVKSRRRKNVFWKSREQKLNFEKSQ